MAVSLKEIKPGRCYVTPTGQVRRVLKVETITKITYEARGKKSLPKNAKWNPKIKVSGEKFAAVVVEEVNWDHDPNYPKRKLRLPQPI